MSIIIGYIAGVATFWLGVFVYCEIADWYERRDTNKEGGR